MDCCAPILVGRAPTASVTISDYAYLLPCFPTLGSAPAAPLMPQRISPAVLVLDTDGTPYSPLYRDVYHSWAGGQAQARDLFLGGNHLPGAWGGRPGFTILETGFGLGTNFLATWAAWRADPRRPGRLDFVSIELHPFTAADLLAWHAHDELHARDARDPATALLAAELAAAWPVLTPGVHRLEFEQGALVLTLVLGDAGAMLANLRMAVDAFYLDGFTPPRNPDAWSAQVCKGVARLAAPGATFATYTVARAVADGLRAVGFTARKAPGFGGKRDMLVGEYAPPYRMRRHEPPARPTWPERHALVIGAGIAGVAAADSLARRGWQVILIETAAGVARGASGTPAGAMHPLLARDDSGLARLTRAGFLAMDRHLAALAAQNAPDWFSVCGHLDIASDAKEESRAADLVAALGLPAAFVRAVDVAAASELAGTRLARGGYWFPRGAWLNAAAYCAHVLATHPARIRLLATRAVHAVQAHTQGWAAVDAGGVPIAVAPVLVLAAGLDLARLAEPHAGTGCIPLQRVRGQITGIAERDCRAPRVVVSGDGYCLPPVQGMVWTGASYGPGDDHAGVRESEHQSSLRHLERLLPDNGFDHAMPALAGHVGFRAVAPDRMPLVGQVADADVVAAQAASFSGAHLIDLPRRPGLYVSGGMASRGLTWAALAGDILASLIAGEPPPLEADLLDAIDPARFLLQRVRRGRFV